MDILTHAISGTAVAACTSTFVKTTPKRRIKILLAGTLGGILPDLDAVSIWSRFDSTFGKLFHLSHTGREIYSMKLWYSHHAFLHSFLSSIIFGGLLMGIIYLITNRKRKNNKEGIQPSSFVRTYAIYFITFVLGYWTHLAGDLPTPSSTWGGIALWWPSHNYVGGFGKIWWWNNYDIFLLILSSICIIILVPLISKYIQSKAKIFSVAILYATFCLILIQINTRQYDYSSPGKYAEKEHNSKKEQERILGKQLYGYMVWFDNKLKFYF